MHREGSIRELLSGQERPIRVAEPRSKAGQDVLNPVL